MAGCMRRWRSLQWTAMTIAMVTFEKKGVGQGKRREGIERWVCFFMLSYFVIVFWLIFFNAGQLISAVVAASCCYHRGEKRLVNSITFFYIF